MQFFDERLAVLATVLQSLLGGKTVCIAFDVEQGVDPFYHLQRYRRDRSSFAATFGVRGDVDQHDAGKFAGQMRHF